MSKEITEKATEDKEWDEIQKVFSSEEKFEEKFEEKEIMDKNIKKRMGNDLMMLTLLIAAVSSGFMSGALIVASNFISSTPALFSMIVFTVWAYIHYSDITKKLYE